MLSPPRRFEISTYFQLEVLKEGQEEVTYLENIPA